MTIEDDLRATLRHAAAHAPAAPRNLLAGVGKRSRRRARTRLLASAAAVALVAAGTLLAVRHETPEPVVINPSLPAITHEQVVGSPPVEKVWPEAVRVVPATFDGRRLRALVVVDDRTTLLSTWGSHENANAVYAHDRVTRETRKVTEVPTRKGEISDGFLVAGDRLIWHVKTDTSAVLWQAPLSGGPARRLPGGLPHVPGRMELRGDRLVYSATEGVFSVPVTGGRPEPVPGGQGLFLLEWPWAGAFQPAGTGTEITFQRLVNLETGEISEATSQPGDTNVTCGVSTCSGLRADGTAFVRGRDGTRERVLPGVPFGLAADRIMGLHDARSGESEQYLVDVTTGRAGSLELNIPVNAGGSYTTIAVTVDRRDMLSAHRTGAETLVIIDLRRIVSGS
ncbi:hypothetical protein [Herbidospora mongoliensis]|uniref:hypothetical protein n=1 Tax=Herbidospora mongoliensis TaxID=688067 RepID=UPI0008334E23|nr:hypothetical protein [Herbidospora mongoliensis]